MTERRKKPWWYCLTCLAGQNIRESGYSTKRAGEHSADYGHAILFRWIGEPDEVSTQ